MADPDILWIAAFFGMNMPDSDEIQLPLSYQISVPRSGRRNLQEMADELVGTECLVALYVPESTESIYAPGQRQGRVIALAELDSMSPGERLEDYPFPDLNGLERWPIGWPCRIVCKPPEAECPSLREHVESSFGARSFAGYVYRLQQGPFRLDSKIRSRLIRDFAEFQIIR